jgi:hypothetical protein
LQLSNAGESRAQFPAKSLARRADSVSSRFRRAKLLLKSQEIVAALFPFDAAKVGQFGFCDVAHGAKDAQRPPCDWMGGIGLEIGAAGSQEPGHAPVRALNSIFVNEAIVRVRRIEGAREDRLAFSQVIGMNEIRPELVGDRCVGRQAEQGSATRIPDQRFSRLANLPAPCAKFGGFEHEAKHFVILAKQAINTLLADLHMATMVQLFAFYGWALSLSCLL